VAGINLIFCADRYAEQIISLSNPTDEMLELVPTISNSNNFYLVRDNERPIVLMPNTTIEYPLHFMPSTLGQGDHKAKIIFHSQQVCTFWRVAKIIFHSQQVCTFWHVAKIIFHSQQVCTFRRVVKIIFHSQQLCMFWRIAKSKEHTSKEDSLTQGH
jgi:hypothetical protein